MKTRNTLRMRLLAFLLMIAMIGSNLTSMRVYAQEPGDTEDAVVTEDIVITEEEDAESEPSLEDNGAAGIPYTITTGDGADEAAADAVEAAGSENEEWGG